MDGSIRFGARWNADGGGLLIGWGDCIAVGTVDSGFAVWDVPEYYVLLITDYLRGPVRDSVSMWLVMLLVSCLI
ncbi:hypothetical protein BO79DRAFT_162390 [Aspergillus costaricaensis CBS 115574]|uniref:Uncharacterized protein n=1 Tax=Aspergillus costaricaensis CBS 115574 TaxID=1448317 RepID=A0ACD1HYL6_9EURO|nr:hypothetical protein BO79DRAFT_162390 [Aspergillus costaricaensis CBS 115574]RAK82857.1 hypothetical protein BO79DRAFT_162390 [Aspergillus costaricaensis CBS 115574]